MWTICVAHLSSCPEGAPLAVTTRHFSTHFSITSLHATHVWQELKTKAQLNQAFGAQEPVDVVEAPPAAVEGEAAAAVAAAVELKVYYLVLSSNCLLLTIYYLLLTTD